ncbi:MAG: hypothetical protein ONB45_19195 [candidate division KSB1 bacterium]|nr:hypothetical protein [candidate division KSB1 bacterium]
MLPIIFATVNVDAQQLPPPDFSKNLNSRTITVKDSWEVDFELKRAGQVVAYFQISSDTDWEDPNLPAVLLEIAIDERLASHLVTYMGRPDPALRAIQDKSGHLYSVHLGRLIAGPHNLALQRADSSTAMIKLRQVRIEVYYPEHPFHPVLAHAPIIFGRSRQDVSAAERQNLWQDPDMRRSDVPLLLAYHERPLGTGKELTYTVFFSNEDGGTAPPALLHRWGRYADIEWAYRVELDDSSRRRHAYFQGRDHKQLVYHGGFENDQPTLQVATLSNVFSDFLTTKLRFALPPLFTIPAQGLRENLMLEAPWSWRVSAKEARREQRSNPHPTDSTRLMDLRRYLYIQFMAQPKTAGVQAGGFFIAKYNNQLSEYASNLWRSDLTIRSDTTILRQTAVPLPEGAGLDDLQRLEFVADQSGGKIVLTNIFFMFSLGANDLPIAWKPSWHGKCELAPGERAVFYVDHAQLRRAYFQALSQTWHFKPDSQAIATATAWAGKPIDEKEWPTIQIGAPWENQGYANYDGIAWYRGQFQLDKSWQGERVWIGFGNVDDRYQLWINGKLARDFPADSLDTDDHLTITEITKLVQLERANHVALRVEDRGGKGGILRPPVAISNFAEEIARSFVEAMADPAIDEQQPFDYFRNPVAILGIKDNPAVTVVTPEGYLNTGFAELMFLGGSQLTPLKCRLKTLVHDLPLVHYQTTVDSIQYAFEALAVTAGRDSLSPLVNWVRVRVQNRSSIGRPARLAVAPRFHGEHDQPVPKISFNPDWRYKVIGRFLYRNELVLLVLPEMPYAANFVSGTALQPETPAGTVEYQWTLAPAESRQLAFCLPAIPMAADTVFAYGLLAAEFDRVCNQAMSYWEKLLSRGMQITVPEPKVNAALRANLAYNLITAGQQDNETNNNNFHLREAAQLVRMYDLFGYHDLAEAVLRQFLAHQKSDGQFSSREPQWGDFGATLWAFGQHVEMTRNFAFGREVYNPLKKSVQWLHQARRQDHWQILPVTPWRETGGAITNKVHSTGDNFYALLGLRHAIQLARTVGAPEDVTFFSRELESLRNAFLRKQREVAKAADGFISPALELEAGFDEGNLAAVYPASVLDPLDEKVTATLSKARRQFEEGLLAQSDARESFQTLMYPNLTLALAATELRRGEQENVIRRLYALLLHTSATHTGCDATMRPWGDRECPALPVSFPRSSRAGFAASFTTLLRDMLVREDGHEVHLLSAVSPAWMRNGEKISVQNAVTNFGKLSFIVEVGDGRMVMQISPDWHTPPRNFVLHLPYFAKAQRIVADGRELSFRDDRADIPFYVRQVEIFWQNDAHRERLSYTITVEDFKREYRERYNLRQTNR